VWRSIRPLLEQMAADESRFAGVTTLGVDEHVWHHVSTKAADEGGRGPKELTGMVDLTRHPDSTGKLRTRARLLDLVPGRTGAGGPSHGRQRAGRRRCGGHGRFGGGSVAALHAARPGLWLSRLRGLRVRGWAQSRFWRRVCVCARMTWVLGASTVACAG
jgi:hypothetical protein